MVKFVTATEAARRIGVNEKTVRAWIQEGKLDAHRPAANRLAIAESDVERLARERRLYQSEQLPDSTALVAKIEDLERQLTELRESYERLERQVQERGVSLIYPAREDETHQAREKRVYNRAPVQDNNNLPPGAVLASRFAEQHGVNRRTFVDHIKKGLHGEKAPAESRPKPGRTHETEYYLLPEQQEQVRDFWQNHGVTFVQETPGDE